MKLKRLVKKMSLKKVKDDNKSLSESALTRVKGHIDYSAGLWLSGWVATEDLSVIVPETGYTNCVVKINGNKVCDFTANIFRPDLNAIPELIHGRGFNIQLPVQAFAKILNESDVLEFSIFLGDEKISHSIKVDKFDIYTKAFSKLYDDVNCYLENIPLFTKQSVSLLSTWNKLFLLNTLFETGLYKNLGGLISSLMRNLDPTESEINEHDSLIGKLKYDNRFIGAFLRENEGKVASRNHILSNLLINTLRTMPYLESKDLIKSNLENQDNIDRLTKFCTDIEEIKFNFIETFPSEIEAGLSEWESLSKQDKREYWPLLAGTLQFKNRHEELKFISIDPREYLNKDAIFESKKEILKAAINEPNNNWFALSFIVQAAVSDIDEKILCELLKEFSWKIWDIDFFDTDSFSYISNRVLNQKINVESYNNICEAFICVLNYMAINDVDSLHRKNLVLAIVNVINYGIKNQLEGFVALEELARPHLCLTNTFSQSLNIEPLKFTDYNQYSWLSGFYRKTERVRAFFLEFDANTEYQDIEIVEILQHLLKLKRKYDVKDIDTRLLTLSRYSQLTQRVQLFPLLKSIHAELGDFYTALKLETNKLERKSLTQKITEHGENSKRTDSVWFDQALKSRLDKSGKKSTDLIFSLNVYLSNSRDTPAGVNTDLAELLISEALWLVKNGVEIDSIIELITPIACEHANTAYNALKLYTCITESNKNNNDSFSGKTSIEFVSELERTLGNIDILRESVESLELPMANIYSTSERLEFIPKIEQHFIFPYTQVLIYSCNKYESTRHAVIRNTWLKDLKKYDIDYAVVVGNASLSHMADDKMCLNVRDTYEELPQKSLTMFGFASKNSFHRHYYKIDDDCVLNVDAMFGDPAFLGSNYFGRIVTRPLGGVDRSWHHLKSSTKEAKEALDLSPENSSYCDGSTGYILSREAVTKLIAQSQAPVNAQLISSSYFEDKLIGDLLSRAKIFSVSQGYNTVIKRNVAGGRDVQIWDYGLLPNSQTNIKVLHTEDDEFRLNYYSKLHADEAESPALIYRDITSNMSPQWFSASEQSPVLEVIQIDYQAIREANVLAIIVGKNEQEFLPNLLEHHRKLGVNHFLFVDNASSDHSIDYMLEQKDVSVFVATQDYKYSRFGVNWQETLCSHFCLGKWTLIIDSDELFMFDGFEQHSIQELTAKADEQGANAILSPMVDFYPKGSLSNADVTGEKPFYEVCEYFDSIDSMNVLSEQNYGPFSNSKVYSAGLRERIFGRYNAFPQPNYLNQKFNLIKYLPSMRLIEGLHFMYGHKVFSGQCGIMHFKYHSGFHAKVMREVESGQHWNGAKEYRRYQDLFENNAKAVLFDKQLSSKYKSSSDLVKSGYVSEIDWSI